MNLLCYKLGRLIGGVKGHVSICIRPDAHRNTMQCILTNQLCASRCLTSKIFLKSEVFRYLLLSQVKKSTRGT